MCRETSCNVKKEDIEKEEEEKESDESRSSKQKSVEGNRPKILQKKEQSVLNCQDVGSDFCKSAPHCHSI
ncbi:hypothetical protein AMECASPLE_024488 [Ameca splendens]|uniref:Uncharacterized protein n=1 Tax=Ameca splendens TaxID=208324 RepID=A0ABV0ZZZ1_9TELE